MNIEKGLQHLLVLLFALGLFVAGSLILWVNKTVLSTHILIGIGACYVTSMLLAIPADFKAAVAFAVPYLPWGKKDK